MRPRSVVIKRSRSGRGRSSALRGYFAGERAMNAVSVVIVLRYDGISIRFTFSSRLARAPAFCGYLFSVSLVQSDSHSARASLLVARSKAPNPGFRRLASATGANLPIVQPRMPDLTVLFGYTLTRVTGFPVQTVWRQGGPRSMVVRWEPVRRTARSTS